MTGHVTENTVLTLRINFCKNKIKHPILHIGFLAKMETLSGYCCLIFSNPPYFYPTLNLCTGAVQEAMTLLTLPLQSSVWDPRGTVTDWHWWPVSVYWRHSYGWPGGWTVCHMSLCCSYVWRRRCLVCCCYGDCVPWRHSYQRSWHWGSWRSRNSWRWRPVARFHLARPWTHSPAAPFQGPKKKWIKFSLATGLE